MYFETWKYTCMFLRRSLAHAYKLHVDGVFFLSVHLGSCPPPPPPYQKAGYATDVWSWSLLQEVDGTQTKIYSIILPKGRWQEPWEQSSSLWYHHQFSINSRNFHESHFPPQGCELLIKHKNGRKNKSGLCNSVFLFFPFAFFLLQEKRLFKGFDYVFIFYSTPTYFSELVGCCLTAR